MKERVDNLLVKLGLVETRSKAKLLIKKGVVFFNGIAVKKAGELVSIAQADSLMISTPMRYVGRGGEKLEAAIIEFNLDFNQSVVADIGASTGGFTDCVLQHGAQRVYAIDVGHDQLAEVLRQDSRVINMEKTNIRDLKSLPEPVDFCVADLSYISLTMVLNDFFKLLKKQGKSVVLFKPQFEVGKKRVGKGGIVRGKLVHLAALIDFYNWCEQENIRVEKITNSPIRGKQGNREYLLLLSKTNDSYLNPAQFEAAVREIL